MKRTINFLAVVLVILTMSIQSAFALTPQSRMGGFFSSQNDKAYKWVSKLAHPSNIYSYGCCEAYGDYVNVTVYSKKHETKIKFHLRGTKFDRFEVLSDTDNKWFEAFEAANLSKDIVLTFLETKYPDTFGSLEGIIGDLHALKCEQICLAALTYLYERYLEENRY